MNAFIPPTPEPGERRIKELVSHLEFRQGLGQCYLVGRARSRVQLYVPTLMESRHLAAAGRGTFNLRTVWAAHDRGLVAVSDWLPRDETPEEVQRAIVCEDRRYSSVMRISLPGGDE